MSLNWSARTLETESKLRLRLLDKEFEQYFWSPYSNQPEPVPAEKKLNVLQAMGLYLCFLAAIGLFAWWMFR